MYVFPQTLIYCLLNENIYTPLSVDTESDITIIPENRVHILGNPRQISDTTITSKQHQIKALEFIYTWNIICPNNNLQLLKDFHLLMVNEDLTFYVGYSPLAFAHSFQNEKYSLVHNLYKDKLINIKVFSLWKNRTLFQDSLLILGKIHSNTKYDNSNIQMQ